ncbi:MAG: mannosyltransferase family protein [Chloroflexota bacterium]|nr:mannosyltransferase family protein [Chloroflexota bacterium]
MVSSARGRIPWRMLIGLWLVWALIVIGFMTIADTRYAPDRPDNALEWTPGETGRRGQANKPLLLDPFMNRQVSFDSEFYLSIALYGYDDPALRTADTPDGDLSLNYAFFPLYPLAMRVVMTPLSVIGLNGVAAATAAGVMLSLLGTLIAVVALYDIDPTIGGRSVFYLLIFPTAFFMTTVYTEGLFIGLAFGCLALARRKHLLAAGILAALATWTRSVGVVLVVPLLFAWVRLLDWRALRLTPGIIVRGLAVLLPIAAYLIWNAALGRQFTLVQENFFGRAPFNFEAMFDGIERAIDALITGDNLQMRAYYGIEFFGVALATIAIVFVAWRDPDIALVSALLLGIALTSGAPQSLIRYVLPIPAIYLMLGRLGRYAVFDRAWTLLSLLLAGMQISLFAFDMWVA